MDAINYLRKEHSKFRKLLKEIGKIDNEDRKQRKFATFCLDLLQHEKMEQKVWYPTLRKDKDMKAVITHLLKEEKSAAQVIKELKKMELGLLWKLRFYKFSKDVDHHAKEEEKELFPLVRKRLSKPELNLLGTKMRKFKTQLKTKA
jgi:hemerythrin superfamily protein